MTTVETEQQAAESPSRNWAANSTRRTWGVGMKRGSTRVLSRSGGAHRSVAARVPVMGAQMTARLSTGVPGSEWAAAPDGHNHDQSGGEPPGHHPVAATRAGEGAWQVVRPARAVRRADVCSCLASDLKEPVSREPGGTTLGWGFGGPLQYSGLSPGFV